VGERESDFAIAFAVDAFAPSNDEFDTRIVEDRWAVAVFVVKETERFEVSFGSSWFDFLHEDGEPVSD